MIKQDYDASSNSLLVYDCQCDRCKSVTSYGVLDWTGLIKEMREAGWSSFYEDGDWSNLCPDCTGKEFKKWEMF